MSESSRERPPPEPQPAAPPEPAPCAEPLVVDADGRREPAAGPRILITNDDGIESPGLRRLALRLAECYEVVVAAPAADRSGSGTGIGRLDPTEGVALHPVAIEGIDQAYSVAGPPGLAVMAAALGAFGRKPDLVVSGVNAGMNTGYSVIHSGTVGAALTARTFGASGLAVSLATSDPWHWETAVEVAADVTRWLLERDGPPMVLNVNVPAVPLAEVRGVTWAELDDLGYFRIASVDHPSKRLAFEVAARRSTPHHGAADTALCLESYVTLTPLSTVDAVRSPAEVPAATVCRICNEGRPDSGAGPGAG